MVRQATSQIDLDPELYAKLLAAAKEEDRPAADIVGDLVRDYVERPDTDPDYEEFLRRKVEKARESMRAGRLISNEDVAKEFAARRSGQ